MRSKQSHDRKNTRQDNQKKSEINGNEPPSITSKSLRSKKTEAKQPKHDLSLFEALVECATREESSGTISDEENGGIGITIYYSEFMLHIFKGSSLTFLERQERTNPRQVE